MTARRAMVTGVLPHRMVGLALMALVHGAALCSLWGVRPSVAEHVVETLAVRLVAESVPPRKSAPPRNLRVPSPSLPPSRTPQAQASPSFTREVLVADATHDIAQPLAAPDDAGHPTAPPPPSQPTDGLDAPIQLATELAVVCPVRLPPIYPSISRRRGEVGSVVLRIELDADGQVALAKVQESSGFDRLDAAALEAVHHWRCMPQRREGRAGRAIALQPFRFAM